MICTRCEGTGFINLHQIPDDHLRTDVGWAEWVPDWIDKHPDTDVQVCDCCGDGSDWYGEPGQHYGPDDPRGDRGPYHNNGGLCQCH